MEVVTSCFLSVDDFSFCAGGYSKKINYSVKCPSLVFFLVQCLVAFEVT